MGCAPDVSVGRVGLLLAGTVRELASLQPFAHLLAAAKLTVELRVQPGFVDQQVRVAKQAVAIEPFDVVALVGASVAPDRDSVLLHGSDQHGSGDRASDRSGVKVGLPCAGDVERSALESSQTLLDHLRPAVDESRLLRPVVQRPLGDLLDLRLIVLAQQAGIAIRDGALFTHPGHRDRSVQAAGESDSDLLADGETTEDVAHADPEIMALLTVVRFSVVLSSVFGPVAGQPETVREPNTENRTTDRPIDRGPTPTTAN